METLEDCILKDGYVLGENILKVDSFLTHQVDLHLMKEIGEVFAAKFKNAGITKVNCSSTVYGGCLRSSNDFCKEV